MKLNSETLSVFKNFSEINPSLQLKSGVVQRTCSAEKSIIAEAELEEEFPEDFAIYELGVLLKAIKFFEDPDFNFKSEKLIISDNAESSFSYSKAGESSIISPYNYKFNFPIKFPDDPEISFALQEKDLVLLDKASADLGLKDVCVVGNGKKISIEAKNVSEKNSSNVFTLDLGEKTKYKFSMVIRLANMKILQGSYSVDISSKGICKFVNNDMELTYWIATEDTSNFDK
jgi:hypothetical protein